MVTKEMKVIFAGFLAALFLILANGMYLFYQSENSADIMSGNSIKEVINKFYETSSVNRRIFILSQFLLLIVIVIVIVMIVRKFKSRVSLSKDDFAVRGNVKSKTDLDTLYEILKCKKEIAIKDIERVFKVDSEVALEWSKILEVGELAIIDYPRFGEPVLRLLEKNDEGDLIVKKDDENQGGVESQKNVKDKEAKKEIQMKPKEKVILAKKNAVPKSIFKKDGKREMQIKNKIKNIDRKIEKISNKMARRSGGIIK